MAVRSPPTLRKGREGWGTQICDWHGTSSIGLGNPPSAHSVNSRPRLIYFLYTPLKFQHSVLIVSEVFVEFKQSACKGRQ